MAVISQKEKKSISNFLNKKSFAHFFARLTTVEVILHKGPAPFQV